MKRECSGFSPSVSDNGLAFIAKAVGDRIAAVGSEPAYIELGSPWEKGYRQSFNAKLHDELLDGEVSYALREASVVIERWRTHYDSGRPYSSLSDRPPEPEVFVWRAAPAGPVPPAQQAIVTRPPLH